MAGNLWRWFEKSDTRAMETYIFFRKEGACMKKDQRKKAALCLILFLILVCCVPVSAASKLPRLQVKGTKLVNSKGKTVQLRGISTHGLSWFPEYVNQSAFTFMKKNWKRPAVIPTAGRAYPCLPCTPPRDWNLIPFISLTVMKA